MAAATSDTLVISQQSVHEEVEEDAPDRLGKLPDDVLLSILKRLDLRDAVRSSVLSRRWRHVPSVLPDIDIDVEYFINPSGVDADGFKSTLSNTARGNMAVARAANSILARRSDQPINNLSLTFFLRNESIGILRAAEDAMSARSRGVVAAEINFLGEKTDILCTDGDMNRQGRRFLSCLSACPRAFAGLTGLHVESVKLRDSDIPSVLRPCQKLERLSLLNCETGRDRPLVLEHSRLTELKLVSCNCDGVELKWLPKLAQVICESWFPSRHGRPMLFGHVPQLRRLMLTTAGNAQYTTLKLSELLVDHAMLGELHLDFRSARIWVQPENKNELAPLLQNLRVVNLGNIF